MQPIWFSRIANISCLVGGIMLSLKFPATSLVLFIIGNASFAVFGVMTKDKSFWVCALGMIALYIFGIVNWTS